MTNYTPAPWNVSSRVNSGGNLEIKAGYQQIACVYQPEWGYDAPTNKEEALGNAQLIAAAPDLVEALLIALPFVEDALLDDGYKKSRVQKSVTTIRKALSSAGVE